MPWPQGPTFLPLTGVAEEAVPRSGPAVIDPRHIPRTGEAGGTRRFPTPSDAGPRHEPSGDVNRAGLGPPLDLLQQQASRGGADLPGRVSNGAEPRPDEGSDIDVIVPEQRHVTGNVQTEALRRIHRADGRDVVDTHHGFGALRQAHQLLEAGRSGLTRVLPVNDVLGQHRQAQSRSVPGDAIESGISSGGIAGPCENPDTAAAGGCDVGHGVDDSSVRVGSHQVDVPEGRVRAHHDGDPGSTHRLEGVGGKPERRHDHAA